MKAKQKIRIARSAHGTTDVILYNPKAEVKSFFALLDIWGSNGYDRFGDGGLYFEVPCFVYDNVEKLPFIARQQIEVEKI